MIVDASLAATVVNFVLTALASGVGISIVGFLVKNVALERIRQSIAAEYATELERLKAELDLAVRRGEKTWIIKRDACLKALNLADAILSNYAYAGVRADAIIPQSYRIEDARACFSELACSCDGTEVIDALKFIAFGNPTPSSIVPLRNAVRRELGFTSPDIDTDLDKAFLGALVCHPDEPYPRTRFVAAVSMLATPGQPPLPRAAK